MSLEKALEGLTGSDQATPTDVAMQLLDEKSALMHTEIRNVKMMNMLKLVIAYYSAKVCKEPGKGWEKPLSFFETLYQANVVHMVPYKRKRAKEVGELFAPLMAMYGMQPENGKGGLFGGKNK